MSSQVSYIPNRGDIVWFNFDPSKGSEQKGNRPAVILTPLNYNSFGLCYCMPITSKIKGYHIEVLLKKNQKTSGAILTNQMLAIDWKVRKVNFVEKLDIQSLSEIDSKLRTILNL